MNIQKLFPDEDMKTYVAVIGAGAAGLCAGKHLIADSEHFVFDIFEQQDDVGGTWRYSDCVGQDEFGLPVHSSMYKNLRTNLPKEVMAFPDFPFGHCDGKSFIHHTDVLQYLKDYAQHYDVYKYIKFRKLIENVRPLKSSENKVDWVVSYSDVVTKEKFAKIYDAVMVCNGHYSVPYIPNIPGFNDFNGVVMHSHDYREPSPFKDLKVVVLGAGPSGIDIAIELCDVAKEVVLSHNTAPKESFLPDNLRQTKGIEFVSESSVTFFGGEIYNCDAVMVCTGYLYHYPFLDPSCNVTIGDQMVSPLYLHMFLIDFPSLAIWAVPKLIIPFAIYDQQTKVFLKFLKGIVKLPSQEVMRAEMEKDFAHRLKVGLKPRHAHNMPGDFQWELDDNLCKLGEIEPISDVVRNLFRHVHNLRKNNLVNYKNINYNILDDKTFVQLE